MNVPSRPWRLAATALLISSAALGASAAQAAPLSPASALAVHAAVKANSVPHVQALRGVNHGFQIRFQRVPAATSYAIIYAQAGRTHVLRAKSDASAPKTVTVAGLKNGVRVRVKVRAFHDTRVLGTSGVHVVSPHVASKPTPAPSGTPTPIGTPNPSTSPTAPPVGVSASLASGVANVPTGGTAKLQAGTYSFRDFAAGDGPNGYQLPASLGKVQGAGVDKTVIQMTPHTSTKAGSVPVDTASGTTNQLSLLELQGSTALSDFTLQGTAQGHLYNGLRVSRTTNTRVTNVRVNGIPGDKNYPPGETFGINDYRTNGSVYSNIEVDGQGVGAAGFGGNDSQNIQINGAYFHGNPYSAGITFWQSSNITLTDVKSENNHGSFNFERDSGYLNIVRPVWSGIGNAHAFSFNSDQASAKVSIYDPVLPAGTSKIYILVAPTYLGVTNKQLKSDIHVYQHGVDVTSKLVVFAG